MTMESEIHEPVAALAQMSGPVRSDGKAHYEEGWESAKRRHPRAQENGHAGKVQ